MFGFVILNRAITPPDVSQSERRQLAKLPTLTLQTLANADFMDGFEDFAADSFAFRENLRTLRAFAVLDVFRMSDKSGLYRADGGAGKFEPVNDKSILQAADKIAKVAETLGDVNIYYAVVPDKNIYVAPQTPGYEPARVAALLAERLGAYTAIDLTDTLGGDAYYRTDLHWDQPRIAPVVDKLGAAMNFAPSADFETRTLGEFNGVYTGQLALPLTPDTMTYLENSATVGATTQYFDIASNGFLDGDMYDLEAFKGGDPYDLFLRGAQPLITITNPDAQSNRELYLFRDSFSSSLAPLLAPYYSRITLIDLRYIDSRVLDQYVKFAPDSDVLFLYSSQILNNSAILNVS
jgi:hypothetical protein